GRAQARAAREYEGDLVSDSVRSWRAVTWSNDAAECRRGAGSRQASAEKRGRSSRTAPCAQTPGALRHGPQDDGVIVRAGRDKRAIRAERNPAHPVGVAGVDGLLLPGAVERPQADGLVVATGDDVRAVRTERDAANVVRVALQLGDRFAALGVEDAHDAVITAGDDQRAVRAERDAPNPVGVLNRHDFFARRHVPYTSGVRPARDNLRSTRAEGDGKHVAFVPFKDRPLLPR